MEVPRTLARNVCRAPGGSVALGGETLTTTCGKMVMLLEALRVASSRLVARSVTGLGEGTAAGARKSTEAAPDEVAVWQGLEPTAQTWPTVVLPPGTPFTCQLTPEVAELRSCTLKVCRWLTLSVAEAGARVTAMAPVSVTVAAAAAFWSALLRARTVSGLAAGMTAGAV